MTKHWNPWTPHAMLALRSMLYRALVRPLLFTLPPETAHHFAFGALRATMAIPPVAFLTEQVLAARGAALEVEAFGLRFPNPVGLAAGFDKNAVGFAALGRLGFGHVEVGTLTAHAQPGNPAPRMFRLADDRALINRMGFNNDGSDAAVARLKRRGSRPVLGVNIGKSKVTAEADAKEDYALSARRVAPFADYLVVNVSSPNTPGLRDLQAVEKLRPILGAVQEEIAAAGRAVPLLVKISPDLSEADVDAVAELALDMQLAGIVATNTTLSRAGLRTAAAQVDRIGAGGLSGAPLKRAAMSVLTRLRRRVGSALTLVAAGGIEDADDAWERITHGASLVQVYTGFIYGGPTLPRRIALGLAERARAAGFARVQDAVGSAFEAGGATALDATEAAPG